jgi:hypothetical protein
MSEPVPFGVPHYPVTAIQPQVFGSANDIIATSKQMLTVAENFMQNLGTAGWFAAPSISPNFPAVPAPPLPVTAGMPTLQQVTWTVPAQPGDFTQQAPDISGYLPGPFTGTAPALVFGTLPVADYGIAPDAPAIDLNFTMPTLSLTIPNAPDLLSLDTVTFAGVTLPTLSADVPNLTAVAPNIIPFHEGPTYVSALLTSLEADLQGAIQDGSYLTLFRQAQQGLWDAGREREYRAQADALAELERMEALGYAFPPGVYIDARIKIQTETDNTITGLSRDIMVKQAELQLENLIKSREQAVQLETQNMNYFNQIAQRSFESAKFAAEAAIQIYNANVEAYKASLDGYRTRASIFDTLMRGAQMQVEIFKAELEGEKLKVDMNTAMVQQYEAKIRAQALFVDIYKAELGAIETQANLQKIIVEAYGEQIKAYVGKINAFSAEVEAYKSQIEAQGVIENVFKTEVEAYTSTVNAGAQRATAAIEGYKAQISGYTAKLEAYKASVTGMAEQARAASEFNQASAEVYRSQMSALASYNEVLTKQWQAQIEISEKVAEVGIQAAKANGELYIQTKNIAVEAAKGGAQVAAQLGAAAMNAVHFSNSSSWSSAMSASLAGSVSDSYSGVNSYSHSASV